MSETLHHCNSIVSEAHTPENLLQRQWLPSKNIGAEETFTSSWLWWGSSWLADPESSKCAVTGGTSMALSTEKSKQDPQSPPISPLMTPAKTLQKHFSILHTSKRLKKVIPRAPLATFRRPAIFETYSTSLIIQAPPTSTSNTPCNVQQSYKCRVICYSFTSKGTGRKYMYMYMCITYMYM